MRLAHIVLAHTLPEQLVRLVGRLHDPNDLVLIHVDRRQSLRPFTTALGGLLERPEVRLLPRVRCRWGGFGLVQAALNGIEAALAADARPDYVCLLSGQDYPIKTRSRMVDVLTRADGHVFLRHFPLPRKGYVDDGGMARLERWYLRPSRRWSLPNRFVPFFPKRRVPGGLRPYGGTQFWLMPGEVAASVISYVAANPGLARFFRHSLVADESFFQMIVLNGPHRARVVNDDLRFVDHEEGEAHPRILTCGDLPALRSAPTALFARKFDVGRDRQVLDLIDNELLGS